MMIRIRAVVGDFYHCSDHLVLCFQRVAAECGASVSWCRYPDQPDVRFDGVDVLVLASMGVLDPEGDGDHWMTLSAQTEINERVRAGMGLLVFHAGTASHPVDGPFRKLVGGHFVSHPPEHDPVTVRPVSDHPICRGVEPFTHPDEHYVVEIDPDLDPLVEISSTHGVEVGGWSREAGKGRVAALTPGHTREMLLDPNLIRLASNAIEWCAGKDVV